MATSLAAAYGGDLGALKTAFKSGDSCESLRTPLHYAAAGELNSRQDDRVPSGPHVRGETKEGPVCGWLFVFLAHTFSSSSRQGTMWTRASGF